MFAFWTPGPVELIIIMLAAIVFIAYILLVRFVFRINKIIQLLTDIRDQLGNHRAL